MRERIQTKVLSSIHQSQNVRINVFYQSCDILEAGADMTVRIYPVRHWKETWLVHTFVPLVLHTVEYRRNEKIDMSDIIAQFNKTEKGRKKFCHAKTVIHGLNDAKGERHSFALIIRNNAAIETVRPFNVAVKKKTELFAPKTRMRASVSIDTLTCAVTTCPGTCGSTVHCDRQRWDQDRGCALFGCVGPGTDVTCRPRVVRHVVLNLPIMAIIDTDTEQRDKQQQVFVKCDRVPQSQLVQVI